MKIKDRRLKVLYIPTEQLLEVFTEPDADCIRIIHINIPDTAYVDQVYYDYARACWAYILYDESFDEVKLGELIPELESESYIKCKKLVDYD